MDQRRDGLIATGKGDANPAAGHRALQWSSGTSREYITRKVKGLVVCRMQNADTACVEMTTRFHLYVVLLVDK